MAINIDEKDLKQGVLGLVMALVEILKDTLKLQAVHRIEGGSLAPDEMERLGQVLSRLDAAVEEIKREQGLAQAMAAVRSGLDDAVGDVLGQVLDRPVNGRIRECPKN